MMVRTFLFVIWFLHPDWYISYFILIQHLSLLIQVSNHSFVLSFQVLILSMRLYLMSALTDVGDSLYTYTEYLRRQLLQWNMLLRMILGNIRYDNFFFNLSTSRNGVWIAYCDVVESPIIDCTGLNELSINVLGL